LLENDQILRALYQSFFHGRQRLDVSVNEHTRAEQEEAKKWCLFLWWLSAL
jgi:hypothetical protein